MNPLADHYLEKCIENIEVGTHDAYRILRGDFTCKCGFKYRLIFPEKNPLELPISPSVLFAEEKYGMMNSKIII